MTLVLEPLSAGGAATRAAGGEPRGRIEVEERALRKVAEAAAAEVIGVSHSAVSADIAPHRGGLGVRVASPLPVPDLGDTAAVEAARPVLDQARSIQQHLRDRLGRLFGRDVVRVDLTITGAVAPTRRRVR